jgi:hypothetical protein
MVAGRYLLQNTIGRGAMGTVWRARDTVLARDVAVKEVRLRGPVTAGSVMTEETRILYQRTLREARTAARLNHPAVVTIFDVVEADGSPWIVMELVQARSLDQVLTADGPLRPQQAADAGLRVLGALACAHAAGIMHRDVKPSNVLLGPDGRVVLTDFGIATLEGDSGLTQAGMVMGTPGFTAPERIRGDAASPASDLWSLGATLYAAVEGRGPFDGRGNSIAILAAIANEEAPRPRSAGPLRQVIEALLHRDPLARPDAATVGRLLTAAGTGTARSAATRSGATETGAAGTPAAGAPAAGTAGAGAGTPETGGPAAPGAPRHAGRRPGEALLTAPLGLALPGPQAQGPASGISQPGTPRPDGQWEGPDDPWPEGPWPENPWPGNARSGNPWSGNARSGNARSGIPWPGGPPEPGDAPWASQIPPPDDSPGAGPATARAPAAGVLAVRALAARAQPARVLAAQVLAIRALAARAQPARAHSARGHAAQAQAAQAQPTRAHSARAQPAQAQAARAPAAGPGAGRHGAPASGLRRGLAADLSAMLPRGRRGLLVILAALAIVGAGILAGMALTSGGSGPGSPAGVQAAGQAGSAAGFTMTVPAGWQTVQQGASTKFSSPAGAVSILVTPTSAGGAQGLGQIRRLLAQALKQGRFPGYQPAGGRRFLFGGQAGAAWQFTWQPASGGRQEVRDIAFRVAAPGGGRAYLVQESAPVVAWAASQPEFRQSLTTFRAGS